MSVNAVIARLVALGVTLSIDHMASHWRIISPHILLKSEIVAPCRTRGMY